MIAPKYLIILSNSMKILYVSENDPNDINSWSGTHYFIYNHLKEKYNVKWLSPKKNKPLIKYRNFINKIYYVFNRIGINFNFYNFYNCFVKSYYNSKSIGKRIKYENFDIIVAVASSTEIAFIKSKPIIYISDVSVTQYLNYYTDKTNILSVWESSYIEKRAISNADYVIYPSLWAKDYAFSKYKGCKNKYIKIPFGANVQLHYENHKINFVDDKKSFNILFVGKQWKRKGGEIVMKTFNKLSKKYDVKLTIVGCKPFDNKKFENIFIYPSLNKNNIKEMEILANLYFNSDVLFVPSRAECYGIVFAEAGFFGLPSITSETGGISEIIKNNVNGFTVPIDDNEEQVFYNIIEKLINNEKELLRLKNGANEYYKENLDWTIFYKTLDELILNIYGK